MRGMKGKSRTRLVAGAASLLLVASSCRSSGIRVIDSDPRLLIGGSSFSGGDAAIRGVLRYQAEAGCFVIERDQVDVTNDTSEVVRHVVVWPRGTAPRSAEGVGVDVPGFGEVRVGDWLEAGGDYASPDSNSGPALPTVESECLSEDGEFAIINRIIEAGDGEQGEG